MPGPGDRAPAFELENLQGAIWRAENVWASQAVLLVFFKVTCPTCQYTLPYVDRLISGAKPDAPALVAISQDDAAETRKFRGRFGLSIPILLDPAPAFTASNLYRITHVPSFFLVEPGGEISRAFDGFQKEPLEQIASRFGATLFTACDRVPASRPG